MQLKLFLILYYIILYLQKVCGCRSFYAVEVMGCEGLELTLEVLMNHGGEACA